MFLRKPIFIAFLISAGIGCGKKDDDKNEAKFTLTDLVGLWSVDCVPSQFGQITTYRVAALQITEVGNFIYENTNYGDDKCTEKYYDESSKGSIQLGSAVDATGKRIAITSTEGTGTAKNDTLVTAANELGICGYKNWVKDLPQDLVGTGCIGWSEANLTDGINLVDTSEGKKQIQVFRLSSNGTQERMAGDDFTKD